MLYTHSQRCIFDAASGAPRSGACVQAVWNPDERASLQYPIRVGVEEIYMVACRVTR